MRRTINVSRPAAFLSLLACLAASSPMADPGLQIDPSRTWVGLARVHLTVTEVQLSDRRLEGAYEIRVPFLPDRNDTGTLSLRSNRPMDELRQLGGTMNGTARSSHGETREVACEILPGGRLRIDIAMERRTVSFKTRYHLAPGL